MYHLNWKTFRVRVLGHFISKYKRKLLFVGYSGLLLLPAMPVVGSEEPVAERAYTLEQLVATALRQNPSLQAARYLRDAASGQVEQAGRLENPSLQLSYSTDQAFNNEGESGFGVGFAQRFPVTSKLRLEREVAQEAVRLADAEIANAERQLRQEVEFAVFGAVQVSAELDLLNQLSELNAKSLEFIESRIERGEASAVDANRLRLEIYSIRQTQRQLMNREIAWKTQLRLLCGLSEVDLVVVSYDLQRMPSELVELPRFERTALEAHPEYQVAFQKLRMSEKDLALARAGRWGDVELELFYEEERGVDEPGGLGRDRFLGIGLSIPLPLHDRSRGTLTSLRAARARLQWELKAVEAQLKLEAQAQRQIAERLYQQVVDYQQAIPPTVESNLKVMNEAYASGQIGLTELFRTQEQSLRIQTNQLELLRELAESLSRWRSTTGLQSIDL